MTKHITFIFTYLIFTTTLIAQKIEEGFDINFKPAAFGWRYYVVTEKKDDLWYREAYYRPEKSMAIDRKSTRLNSSHRCISYAVFCLKKKRKELQQAK